MFFEDHQRWKNELGYTVTGPGRLRSHDQCTNQDQGTIIVDTPASKISPSLFTICFDGKPSRGKLVEHCIKLLALHAYRVVWKMRILRIGDIEIIRNAP